MNYEEMSDFEVNSLVARKYLGLFVDLSKSKGKLDSDAWLIDSEGLLRWSNYNPCRDPKHAWPIIIDNKISLIHSDDLNDWFADIATDLQDVVDGDDEFVKYYADNNIMGQHKNPLRAAMICFLKMKDSECKN